MNTTEDTGDSLLQMDAKTIRFLFWNINRKRLTNNIENLVFNYDIDILMLAESEIPVGELLAGLNRDGRPVYRQNPGRVPTRIEIYSKFPPDRLKPVSESDYYTIRHLRLPYAVDLILAVVHFPSKLYSRNADYIRRSGLLSDAITEEEETIGHARSLIVGDLNMNPFEDGAVMASGLHAVMTRSIALKRKRRIEDRQYPFFYNPMWSLLGDASQGPAGTYHYGHSGEIVFYWHMFDQVLIRPDLIGYFQNADLKILETDGLNQLVTDDGLPDANNASDHLPLLFSLALPEEQEVP